MKRLRHPIRAIREPFGTAGLIVACVALIAALGGTAFAAAKLNSTQKKEVEKIAKKFAGKPGANGANGANGSPGAKGDAGAAGSNGTNGKSVVASAAPVGTGTGKCVSGGTKFEVEGSSTSSVVCNGKDGTTGFTETLPSGKTETGVWQVHNEEAEANTILLSFPIPLAEPLGFSEGLPGEPENQVHFIDAAGEEVPGSAVHPACPGTPAEPKAAPGNLCIYTHTEIRPSTGGPISSGEDIHNPAGSSPAGYLNGLGASTAGAWLELGTGNSTTPTFGQGTWAVTAP